jgi:hypothetical protein
MLDIKKENKLSEDFVALVKEKIESGVPETEIRKFVRDHLALGKTRGNEVYNEIKRGLKNADEHGLKFISDKYVYNSNTDTYVINIKSKKSPLCISGAKHRAICRAYSAWSDDLTANDICVKFSLTPEIFSEYRKIFNLSKDREPLSVEEVVGNTVDDSVASILEEKRYKIYQGYEKELWRDTQAKADKWDDLNAKTLDTLRLALDGWSPPNASKKLKLKNAKQGLTFVASLSDNHIGEIFRNDEAYHGKDFNSEIACEIVDKYSENIVDTVESRAESFSKCVVVVTGDFLHSCVDGHTRKGTHLHSDKVNEDMFILGMNSLTRFIQNMADVFPSVTVIVQKGNHDSFVLTYMAIAVEKYFSNNPNVDFLISNAWASFYRLNNIAMIITHGGHDTLKKALDPVGIKLKSFIQELFLQKAEAMVGCTQRIVLSGHKHAYNQSDMGSFEFYCLGSSVKGDNYADAHGLYHQPRQNCLILDENKVLETLHYYL